jgi:hypothetical protein
VLTTTGLILNGISRLGIEFRGQRSEVGCRKAGQLLIPNTQYLIPDACSPVRQKVVTFLVQLHKFLSTILFTS